MDDLFQCAKCGADVHVGENWVNWAKKYPDRVLCKACKGGNPVAEADKVTATKKTYTKSSTTTRVNLPADSSVILQEFRKVFDEVTAEFSAEFEAGQMSMEDIRCITNSVLIELNNRKKGK